MEKPQLFLANPIYIYIGMYVCMCIYIHIHTERVREREIHHQLNGHEFGQILGEGEGQGSLECYSPWVSKSQT